MKLGPQERWQQPAVEPAPVPRSWKGRVRRRTVLDMSVPQILDEIIEVTKLDPQERVQESFSIGQRAAEMRRRGDAGRRLRLRATCRSWMVQYGRGRQSCTAGGDFAFRRIWERGERHFPEEMVGPWVHKEGCIVPQQRW